MISVKNLTRRYGSTVAIEGVSTDISRGEIVGLLGHNGAGKTTMMKVLTGFLEPSSGSVSIDGKDVVANRQDVQRLIGYLPENAPVYPEMLVQDYLLMMAGLRGVPPEKREQAVADAVLATGLADRVVQPIGTLSKGLRQRVGLAQAIVHKPAVLILDEPTNGLDPTQIASIRTLIRRLGQNTTILLSTHILQEVEAVCDRVLVLIGGKLVADSPLKNLLSSNAVRVSVAQGTDGVAKVLGAVPGVSGVQSLGPDEALQGFEAWVVNGDAGAGLSPAVARAALDARWTVGSIAPEHRSLENVFNRLEKEQIARREVTA
jgi:ABC-2 type transport system ATP-binding protein